MLCLCASGAFSTAAWAQDTTPPVLSAANADQDIRLVFSEELDEGVTIPADRFAVTADGSTLTVDSVVTDYKTVVLSLSPALEFGQTIVVT